MALPLAGPGISDDISITTFSVQGRLVMNATEDVAAQRSSDPRRFVVVRKPRFASEIGCGSAKGFGIL